jgi:hypothetical protein
LKFWQILDRTPSYW